MILNRTLDATEEPVTLNEVKQALRIDYTEEDDFLSNVLKASRQLAEQQTRMSFLTQTWELRLDRFPSGSCSVIEIPRGPVQSVSSVTYVDDDGVEQTWDSSEYRVDVSSLVARIEPAYSYSWPTSRSVIAAVTITYVTGYTSAEDVPFDIKQAILMMCGHFNENREETSPLTMNRVPIGAVQVFNRYKVWTV